MVNEESGERRYTVGEILHFQRLYETAYSLHRCAIVNFNFRHLQTKSKVVSETEEALFAITEYENKVPERLRERIFEQDLKKQGFGSRERTSDLQEIITHANKHPEEFL